MRLKADAKSSSNYPNKTSDDRFQKGQVPISSITEVDYNTISDIILHITYTAFHDGAGLRKAASDSALAFQKTGSNLPDTADMFAALDLKNDFPSDWYCLILADKLESSTMPLTTLQDRLPFFTKGTAVKAETISVLLALESAVEKDIELTSLGKITFKARTPIVI
ncbi:hypothetical protein GGS24DRAFT_502423 [Hypoxylon argillaceum]|nr:hypothetical protein GGS24DRAFT_502423 [Hypoxylon argillaceum]